LRQVGYLPELYEDARSEKINKKIGSRSVKVINLKTHAGMMQALKIRCNITVPNADAFIAQDNYY
jgi:hypothetical protein